MIKRFLSSSPRFDPVGAERFDVLIVGGGMVGNSMAAALSSLNSRLGATSKLRIGLIDRGKAPVASLPSSPFDNRVSSLSMGSVAFLRDIGVWNHVDASRVCPYSQIEAWDARGGRISFDAQSIGESALACMIENRNLIAASFEMIKGGSDVTVMSECGIDSINTPRMVVNDLESAVPVSSTQSPFVEVVTSEGGSIMARLIIGADGAASSVREAAGFSTTGWHYDQRGLVATLEHEESDTSTAYQKFSPLGIVAILPLSPTRSSMVWSTSPDNAAKLKSLPAKDFCAVLNAAIRLPMGDADYVLSQIDSQSGKCSSIDDIPMELDWRYDQVNIDEFVMPPMITGVQENSRAAFPLRFQKSTSICAHRVALVGDAAHVVHPMAGQGVNLGIGDVRDLAAVIEESLRTGQDIGSYVFLKDYVSMAEPRVMPMCAGIEALWNLFAPNAHGDDNYMLSMLRQTGMDIINEHLPSVKQGIVRRAMGI